MLCYVQIRDGSAHAQRSWVPRPRSCADSSDQAPADDNPQTVEHQNLLLTPPSLAEVPGQVAVQIRTKTTYCCIRKPRRGTRPLAATQERDVML